MIKNFTQPMVISIIGKKNSGKTTFLAKLTPVLKARGYRIGVIKHDVHGYDIDHEGTDSWQHKHSGAHTVAVSSPQKISVIKDTEQDMDLDEIAKSYFSDVDLVITEGYKTAGKPQIEIFRSSVHKTTIDQEIKNLVALVSDESIDEGVPCFDIEEVEAVADFIEAKFLKAEE